MKKSLILLTALALFDATPGVAAKGDRWVGPQFGGSVPTSDFTKSAKTGFQGGLAATYMETEQAGIGVDVAYHLWSGSNDANADAVARFGPGSELKFSAIQATAHVLYAFRTGGKARPYAKVGFGPYWLKTKVDTRTYTYNVGDALQKFGYNMGAGVNFKVSPTQDIGIGGMYHVIVTGGPGPSAGSRSAVNLFTLSVSLMWGAGAK